MQIDRHHNPVAALHRSLVGLYQVYYRNAAEFQKIYAEIFENREYRFNSNRENPVIIDCGAHIGLATLFFKQQYPGARIIAFEPDERNLAILRQNIEHNNLTGIEVVPAAAWSAEGSAAMYPDQETANGDFYTWGNTLIDNIWGDAGKGIACQVRTVQLSRYINGKVDFLKMDIEGSEEKVLLEIREQLGQIRQLCIEFHGTNTSDTVNSLTRISELLVGAHFTVSTDYKSAEQLFSPETIASIKPVIATISAINRNL